jgi:hypothetical protein
VGFRQDDREAIHDEFAVAAMAAGMAPLPPETYVAFFSEQKENVAPRDICGNAPRSQDGVHHSRVDEVQRPQSLTLHNRDISMSTKNPRLSPGASTS